MSTDVMVIGAGPAGLATSRELTRAGLEHVVLERGEQVGETWANLYDSLVLHTARRLSALPGLAFPPSTPLFPGRNDFLQYLHRYAETFRVPVSTRTKVTALRRANGRWTATTATGEAISASFAVVATGIVSNPVQPEIPHRHEYSGRVMHSVDYRRPDGFAGQRVLVVGVGNSAGEISAELAHAGAAVTVAVRSGTTVVPRDVAGVPIQYLAVPLSHLPKRLQALVAALVARLSELVRGPAVLPRPTGAGCRQVPLIGFHLPDAIRSGAIRLQRGVEAFTRDGVRFTGGTAEPFDTVILATGYRAALDLLGPAIHTDGCGFAKRQGRVASADDPTLFFVGHNYDLRGGLLNISQDARLAVRQIVASGALRTLAGSRVVGQAET